LIDRYYGAVYRYLLGATRDEDAALELFQDFAVRFLRGDFRRANPELGRFRDYLKTALIHMVTDHRRAGRLRPITLADGGAHVTDPQWEDEAEFARSWREELIDQAWKVLATQHPTHHAALALHVDQPDLSSSQLAEQIGQTMKRPVSAGNMRVILHRARERFAEILVEQVEQSLGSCTSTELKAELEELQLLSLCGDALAKRSG
jgi:RNA polymerase sigma-70 factor (ECF subfamily)